MANTAREIANRQAVAEAAGRRHPMEWFLFGLYVLLSAALIVIVILIGIYGKSLIESRKAELVEEFRAKTPGAAAMTQEEILPFLEGWEPQVLDAIADPIVSAFIIVFAVIGIFVLIVCLMGYEYGKLRAFAVRITPEQFPDVYELWESMAMCMGMKRVPELYVINGDGQLNAYAACIPGFRYFSGIYSDILEACLRNEDWDSLKFILGHELGHMKLSHVTWWWLTLTALTRLPFADYVLGNHLSRAQEYSCDKIGHAIAQDDSYKGLLMLTAGKHLYTNVESKLHLQESASQRGFWMTIYNLLETHPILAWRISALHRNHNGGVFLYHK